ncbi:hypothetical protein J2736_003024 [Paenibacillus qinlingensis]|uniref:Uncharacterized protein n=2 Tax=Paenibacillus qinlingensis TaxID=1837343 RepID=A0ABU1NWH1_9BACL|nr:hypothetical protein [Paenibacillus qinlingensis]
MGFNLLNMLWLFITAVALIHIFKKRIPQNRRWMIRSYVFCYTNMLIRLLSFAFNRIGGIDYAMSYMISVYASIAALLAVPEVLFRFEKRRSPA